MLRGASAASWQVYRTNWNEKETSLTSCIKDNQYIKYICNDKCTWPPFLSLWATQPLRCLWRLQQLWSSSCVYWSISPSAATQPANVKYNQNLFWSVNFFRRTMHSKSPVVNLAERHETLLTNKWVSGCNRRLCPFIC